MFRQTILCVAALAVAALTPPALHASRHQGADRTMSKGESVAASGTIEAIDSTARLVTIKSADGSIDTIYAGPEVKRFDELKVGDRIKMRYYESVVLQLRKAGDPSRPAQDDAKVTPAQGGVLGGTLARQKTMTVSVVAVDPKTPSIAVKTSDGHTITRKVQDVKRLDGVQPGDRIDIVYTQAAVIEITPVR